jgi:amidohydrolase family protein/IPT/TIG domain-containing protein
MKSLSRGWYGPLQICLPILFCVLPLRSPAQAQQAATLVIEGGTLIDGNGGTPVPDAMVVIQGNKITNVTRRGQASYPANAQVVKANGKFIVPGLWDSHTAPAWFMTELFMNYGVTSIVDTDLGGELGKVHRDAVNHGKIPGPRYFTSLGSESSKPRYETGWEPPLFPYRVPKSPQEARELTKRFLDAGADHVFLAAGELPMSYYEGIFDEAKKANKPVVVEFTGRDLEIHKAAELGAAQMPHSPGVGRAIAHDPAKWRVELDFYADMNDAKARDLIKLLVEKKVALVPNLINMAPGYPKDWQRYVEEEKKVFSDPYLMSYFPEASAAGRPTILGLLRQNANRGPYAEGAVLERRRKGYQNLLRFHHELVEAGGRVLPGGNTNLQKVPGLSLHHEMEEFAAAGFTPMQIVQSATKWAAEALRASDRLGTIEAGKLADLLILNANPLEDIRNLQKIDTLIFNGKVTERGFHPWVQDPFYDIGDLVFGNPPVELLSWVAAFKKAIAPRGEEVGSSGDIPENGDGGPPVQRGGIPNPGASPQPAIETISPTLVTEGSPTMTLTIKGFNFVRRSMVFFNGRSVPYKAVSPAELQVTLDETLLRTPGKFDIVVKNPEPVATPEWGNGSSNSAHLLVNFRY